MNASVVLRKPIITEKASLLREKNQFVLAIRADATKSQIRELIKARFKVNPLSIRTVRLKGKYRRRMGPQGGYKSDWKKAIVTLKQGQQITWEEAS